MEGFCAFYTGFGVCWRSASAAATAGRVPSRCGVDLLWRGGEDEDDVLRLVFIHDETVSGSVLMVDWAVLMGSCWAAVARQVSQVGSLLFSIFLFFCFLFPVFYFEFCFISNLFCRIFNVWILLGSL
jgi:hypothetical protein